MEESRLEWEEGDLDLVGVLGDAPFVSTSFVSLF